MHRSWFKFSIFILVLSVFVFAGGKRVAWASSDAAPFNQCGTVPCRNTLTPTRISPTPKPPVPPAPTDTPVPQVVIPTATHTLLLETLKPLPTNTNTNTSTATNPALTNTYTQPVVTVITAAIPATTINQPVKTSLPQPTPVTQNNKYLPATGAFLVLLLGVVAVIIWRNRAR